MYKSVINFSHNNLKFLRELVSELEILSKPINPNCRIVNIKILLALLP